MKRSWGFTLVEILITITVMGILLTFAVVSLSGSLARARDDDRKTDVNTIAIRLESLYRVGFTFEDLTSITQGEYPSTQQMNLPAKRDEMFKDFDLSGRTVSGTSSTNDSIVTPLTDNINYTPANVNEYAYIPLRFDTVGGAFHVCEDHTASDCRRFIIRYRLESDPNTVLELRSKNQ